MFRQVLTALRVQLQTIWARPRNVILMVAGFLIASFTLVLFLALDAGLHRLAGITGLENVVLVISATAQDEASSNIQPDIARIVSGLPDVARGPAGGPIVASQFLAASNFRKLDGETATVLIRGVSPEFWQLVSPAVHVRARERPRSGLAQLLAGAAVARNFVAMDPGARPDLRGAPWRITGEFAAGGGVWESELWTDIGALQAAFNAQGQISVLWVKLASANSYEGFSASVANDPRLQGVRVVDQRKYYSHQLGVLSQFVASATIGIGIALGLGAILAIANALSMALAARRTETAILRALGYQRSSIGVALLAEVLLIGLVSTIVGIAICYLTLDGRSVSSSTVGQAIDFSIEVSAPVAIKTLVYCLLVGALGAFWPIRQHMKLPLTAASR